VYVQGKITSIHKAKLTKHFEKNERKFDTNSFTTVDAIKTKRRRKKLSNDMLEIKKMKMIIF
jgi:ribosomal protein S2